MLIKLQGAAMLCSPPLRRHPILLGFVTATPPPLSIKELVA
jgi:hypothetical protein